MAELKKPKDAKSRAANDDTETQTPEDKVIAALGIEGERLIGSVADFLLQSLKTSRELKSWAKMTQADQDAEIDRVEKQSRHIVGRVLEVTANRGFKHFQAILPNKGKWEGDDLVFSIAVPMTPENVALIHERSGHIQVVFADAKEFEGPMKFKSAPDAPRLRAPGDAAPIVPDVEEPNENGADTSVDEDKPNQTTSAAPGAAPSM